MKKTLMIVGVSSFIGSNFLEVLKNEFRIIGTYHKTPVSYPGVVCVPCDVLKKDYVSSLVSKFVPDYIIYCAGLSSISESELNPKTADALNAVGAVNYCNAADRVDAKFIYISSAFVFNGEDVLHSEEDTPFPETVYGSTISATEFYIQRSSLNYLILRCSCLYGRSFNPYRPNWFEYLQNSLAEGKSIQVDDSITLGFLDVQLICKFLTNLLNSEVSNRIFQISSSDFKTRYEFSKTYAKLFKKDDKLILKSRGDFPSSKNKLNASKSLYFKMAIDNFQDSTGIKLLTVEESLKFSYMRFNTM